jgi:hypothetical protein
LDNDIDSKLLASLHTGQSILDILIHFEDKILALMIQLPPSMGIVEGMHGLWDIIPELDKRFRYAVEVS